MKENNKAALHRRHFLLTIGAGAAATAAVMAGKSSLPEQPTQGAEDKRRGKGYSESAHVRSYYRTTKV